MIQQMTVPYWLDLPVIVRTALAKTFNLVRSQGSTVEMLNGKMEVKCDGYTNKDLSVITVEKLQEFLKEKKEKDFWKLMEATIAKLAEESTIV